MVDQRQQRHGSGGLAENRPGQADVRRPVVNHCRLLHGPRDGLGAGFRDGQVQDLQPSDDRARPAQDRFTGRAKRPLPRRRPDRRHALFYLEATGGEGGEMLVRHPGQLGEHQQAAVAAAEHAGGPAVRGQPPERRLHRIAIRFRGMEGFAGGPAERGSNRHARRMPAELVDLGGGEPGGGAAVDHLVDRVPGHRGGADGAGGVHPAGTTPGPGRPVRGVGRRGSSAAPRDPPRPLPRRCRLLWLACGGRSSPPGGGRPGRCCPTPAGPAASARRRRAGRSPGPARTGGP